MHARDESTEQPNLHDRSDEAAMDDDRNLEIRFRAHELWEANGRPNGHSFWERAEAELRANHTEQLGGRLALNTESAEDALAILHTTDARRRAGVEN